jgi:large subunit ribosomal protein L22
MEAIAKGKFLRGSPQKARLVIDMIRGKNVAQALAILQFTNKRATENIEKCLRSAIANATFKAEQDNIAIDPDDLWVKTCFVDMGPHKNRRRVRPAPQGRAYREQRYYCHVTIQLTSEQPANAKPVGKTKKAANISKSPATPSSKSNKNASAAANAKDVKATPVAETAAEVPAETPVEQLMTTTPPVDTLETVTTNQTQTVETTAADETATDSEAKKITKKAPAKNKTESTSEEKKTD